MNFLTILWHVNLLLVVVGGIVTARAIFDSMSQKQGLNKALASAFAPFAFFMTVSGAVFLYMPLGFLGSEYLQPKFGWIILSILVAIFVAWKLGCFTPEKTEDDSKESIGVVAVLKSMLPASTLEVIETVYGLDSEKAALTKKPLFVDESTPATEGYWAGVSNWRQRDFKGSLIQWLKENGPKSHLIPATKELCQSLQLGSPYWNKNIVYGSDGVSLMIWDKKFFFKWEDLYFHVEYDLYDRSTVEISETSIVFKQKRTFHLVARDGTEIGWNFSSYAEALGNFEVEVKFPRKVISQLESYVFEYQDGVSGCYGENIPVYYFASDLVKKVKDEKKAERAQKKVAKKS